MKKIINGKKYDTETARVVGSWSYGNPGDFRYQVETLYCKKTGEYFLEGEGGPLTDYRTSVGTNSWTGGCQLIPYTLEEAQQWAMQYMDGDDYEEEFGEVEE
ncbi:hypothetical protein NE634_14595 [Lacrimispora saccharolytica]|nr:hypothetical protein [Lacrimispora saccharolytica]